MRRRNFLRRLFMISFVMVLVFPAMLGKLGQIIPLTPLGQVQTTNQVTLTEIRKTHILYGDATGGGHLYGSGRPCASEFPASWRAEDIISHIVQHASNDNLDWEQQHNGNYVAETMDGALRIRIVLNGTRSEIVTAYPVNVQRNPCGKAANDN